MASSSGGLPLARSSRQVRVAVAAGAAAAAGVTGVAVWRTRRLPAAQQTQNKGRGPLPRPALSAAVIDAVAGAMGEVASISLLYPLDTIKVRCQAQGLPAREVVASLAGLGPRQLAALLFAGAGQAVVASVLVGAVHYWSFCSAKRACAGWLGPDAEARRREERRKKQQQQQQAQQHPFWLPPWRRPGQQPQPQQPHRHIVVAHGAGGSHFLPVEEPLCGSDDPDCTVGIGAVLTTGGGGGAHGNAHGGTASTAHHGGGGVSANLLAAAAAAVATALVEAPLELFRHNAQAGTSGRNFLGEMWRVAYKARSPAPLYRGLTAYALEALPYDFTELAVVGGLTDHFDRAAAERQRQHGSGSGSGGAAAAAAAGPAVPRAALDLAAGAAAGAAAVVVSMPFDVVKTWMQVHPSARGGLRGFADTARALVARGGPGALWLGLWPRLAHQVPGACVCWLAIHTTHRKLNEHYLLQQQQQQQRGHPHGAGQHHASAAG